MELIFKYGTIVAGFLLLPLCAPAGTESLAPSALRNPFFLPEEEDALLPQKLPAPAAEVKEALPLNLVLEATFISESGREKVALISGQIVKEGESIEGTKVVSINKDGVLLKGIGTAPLVLPAVVNKNIEQ